MQKLTFTILACLGILLGFRLPGMAQIKMMQDYQNKYSAPIGTFQGINFREGGFSGMYPIQGTDGKEFWVISDRGVNIDAANANSSSCRPTYDKIFVFPNYAPKIHRVRLSGDSIQILQTITMKRPNGTGATGILNPTGYGSTEKEVGSTDTVLDCSRFNMKTAPKDIWGIDAEGIVVDKDGNFWISEENGPTIWKLNANGVVIKRYTPYANLLDAQSIDVQIDTVFKYRKNNRGFEGISITPNGKIYAIIQSPILYPNKFTGEGTQVHRILEIDPATNATRMFVYLNDGIIGTGSDQIRLRDWKIGDMAAINDTTFLVLEAGLRGTTDIKRLYKISIKNASVVTSGLYGGKTLEALVDMAGLTSQGITPVKKTLVMDLLVNGWPSSLEKAEGLAILNDSTIFITNDNDYGQVSALENGIATETGITSHILKFSLSNNSKLQNFTLQEPTLNQGITGPSTKQSPYLLPLIPGFKFTSILSAGETVNGYKMAGLPDGSGAFDNGDGTFTWLVNHELSNTAGVVRAHGSKGAFVSKWVIYKKDLTVISGSDLIRNLYLWNPVSSTYTLSNSTFPLANSALNRFCSADMPKISAFYNSKTGLGTQNRIFMDGEEAGNEGRAFGHIVTGNDAGTSYELPYLGKFSWENSVANPHESDTTIVAGTDDATPGQVYFYIGTKKKSGTDIDKAGLNGGKLFGVAVNGLTTEISGSLPTDGTMFTLADLGYVLNTTGIALNTQSNAAGVTSFLRPEDGNWDPSNPSDFYFITTNAFNSPSRLWKLHFNDLGDLEKGGTVTVVLKGTEGQQMLDNMTIDNNGHIIMQEDVGNNAHIGKMWQYDMADKSFKQIAQHDPTRFLNGGANFLTQDEEASGVIDAQEILGPGMFLTVDQAHYSISGDVVEGGQLLAFFNPDAYNTNPEIALSGNNINIEIGDNSPITNDNTDMGSTKPGVEISKTFAIKNSGPGVLTISKINISGTNKTDFTVSSKSLPLTIAANGSETITVKFKGNVFGNYMANINVMSNDIDEADFSFTVKANVMDTVKPMVVLNGNNVDTLEVNSVFNDLGVNVTDNHTKNIKNTVSGTYYASFPNGKATKTGSYDVIYTAADSTGNTASITRKIVVVDTQAPDITINGEQNISVCRWSSYTDEGYIVTDNYDKTTDITVTEEGSFKAQGTGVEGLYSLRYKAVDKSGNVSYSPYRAIFVRNPYEFPCATNVGINKEISLEKAVTIYPNPNQGKFIVETINTFNDELRMTITNSLGQEIKVVQAGLLYGNVYQVDLSDQPAGVYFIKIATNHQTTTKHVVVNK
ncbi:MAG: choice-of-anchor D domain-containing protein [Sphingobacteriales bacterium]|nr:MAG: choice-of-anchor D domain-containing protein [Sphingobacteriales bacterium]